MDDSIVFGEDSFSGKILLIDFSNISYRALFAILPNEPDRELAWYRWKGMIVESILNYVKEFAPDRVIVAIDSDVNWRKAIYPDYKLTASRANTKLLIDKDRFKAELILMINELRETFGNTYFLKVDNTEADDIIAIITKEHAYDSKIIIISADNDFCQLSKYDNVTQYDPKLKKKEVINAKQHVGLKIITGDRSDNIPGIKYGIGPVRADAIWINGIDNFISSHPEDPKIKENYLRNRLLIDFEYIPKEIEEAILKAYKDIKLNNIVGKNLVALFAYNSKCSQKWYSGAKEAFSRLK